MRLLVLGTFRDSELAPRRMPCVDTLAALRRQNRVTRIELVGPRRHRAWSRSWKRLPGTTLDDDGVGLAHAVYRETDGNPFFVSEVLRHLAETGAIYQDADRSVGGRGRPRARSPCRTACGR